MKAILIARVSTEEQKEAGNSLPAQMLRLERYCENKGLEILKSFSFDESAYKNQRDEFDGILDFVIEQKQKIAVCCDKVDRLSRNMFDKRVSELYEKALRDEVELHFVSDGQIINSRISAAEKFHFGISLGLAKYYSDAISDNVRRAIEAKLRRGEWLARAPYGYHNVKAEDGKADVVVDEYESRIVQKVFEWYATGAYSLELACNKLKADYGIVWPRGYLAKVLDNPFYYGQMRVKGKLYPHKYPPIICITLFEDVQAVKNSFAKKKYKFMGKPYLYRGLIRCAHCGLSVTPEIHKGYVYYHCTQYNGKHDAKWLREEEITRQLGAVFKNLQLPAEILDELTDTLNASHQDKMEFHQKETSKLIQEQKTITKMMDNLYLDKLKGRITESAYDKFYTSLRDQVTDISIRVEQLQEAEDNYYITAKYVLNLTSRAYELFISSEVEEKRQLIKLILQNLHLKDEKLVWEAHSPFNLILECSDRQVWRPH